MSERYATTLYPHHALAVAHLGKDRENRNRPPPAKLVGQRIAIHAGASLPREWRDDVMRWPEPCWTAMHGAIAPPEIGRFGERGFAVVTRAVVATARVVGVSDDGPWRDHRWRFGWLLDDVRPLDPVPVERGQLGCWRLAPDVAARIDAQGGWS